MVINFKCLQTFSVVKGKYISNNKCVPGTAVY